VSHSAAYAPVQSSVAPPNIQTDATASALALIGKIFIWASVVAAIGCFIAFGNAYAIIDTRDKSFNFWAALGGGIGGLVVALIPGLLLLAVSKLIEYAQRGSEYARATFECAQRAVDQFGNRPV